MNMFYDDFDYYSDLMLTSPSDEEVEIATLRLIEMGKIALPRLRELSGEYTKPPQTERINYVIRKIILDR